MNNIISYKCARYITFSLIVRPLFMPFTPLLLSNPIYHKLSHRELLVSWIFVHTIVTQRTYCCLHQYDAQRYIKDHQNQNIRHALACTITWYNSNVSNRLNTSHLLHFYSTVPSASQGLPETLPYRVTTGLRPSVFL